MSLASEQALTIASLVDEAQDTLHGYVRTQQQRTTLSADMTASAAGFTVAEPAQLSQGVVEIDDELVYVSQVDPLTGMVTVPPWGRGQSGSTAAAHTAGARVTMSPLFPRQRVASTIYGVLREVFPDVFAVAETLFDVNPARSNYTMPADCFHIMHVEWQLPGPTGMWVPAGRWRQNKTATIELELISGAWPGQDRARVRYMRIPPAQVSGSDDLTSYGYSTQIRDLIVLGASARMLAFVESSRVQVNAMESLGRSEAVPVGGARDASRYLFQLFKQRVEDERRQLLLRYPLQPHRTR